MSKEQNIRLECQACKRINYFENKNRHIKDRLEKNKFCKFCGKHIAHKETR